MTGVDIAITRTQPAALAKGITGTSTTALFSGIAPKSSGTALVTVGGVLIVAGMAAGRVVDNKDTARTLGLVLFALGWLFVAIGLIRSANNTTSAVFYGLGVLLVFVGAVGTRAVAAKRIGSNLLPHASIAFMLGWALIALGRLLHAAPKWRTWMLALVPLAVVVLGGLVTVHSDRRTATLPYWVGLLVLLGGWLLLGATTA